MSELFWVPDINSYIRVHSVLDIHTRTVRKLKFIVA